MESEVVFLPLVPMQKNNQLSCI